MPLIPLFPLPLVLLPGAPLPLHVFEPRYRRMLADCLAGDRRFGLVHLAEGEDEGALPAGRVGCVATIERAQALPDGRSNIAVVGAERFALVRLVASDAPYRVAEVDWVRDEPEAPDAALEARVRATFERVARAARTLADDTSPPPALPEAGADLAFAIAAVVDLDVADRQRLLASRSPSERLRQVDALLSPAVETVEQRAAVHRQAKSNGHGPHHG